MTNVACESKLHSVLRPSMHPCAGNWVVVRRRVVYCARTANAFSAGIKCRHCTVARSPGWYFRAGGLHITQCNYRKTHNVWNISLGLRWSFITVLSWASLTVYWHDSWPTKNMHWDLTVTNNLNEKNERWKSPTVISKWVILSSNSNSWPQILRFYIYNFWKTLQCRHLIPALIWCVGSPGITHDGTYGCLNDLSNILSFDSQGAWVVGLLCLFS